MMFGTKLGWRLFFFFRSGLLLMGSLGNSIVACSYNHSGVLPTLKAPDRVEQAREQTRQGHPSKALANLEALLKEFPNRLDAHRGYIEAAYYANQLEEAQRRYETFLQNSSTREIALYGLGLLALAQGPAHYPEAIERFAKAERLKPEEGEFAFRTGLAYMLSQANSEALQALARAVSLSPRNPGFRIAYAHVLADQGRPHQAVDCLRELWDFSPNTEQVQKARTITAKIFDPLHLLPDFVVQEMQKALNFMEQDNSLQAQAVVDKMLADDPSLVFGWILKGMIQQRMQNSAQAISAFQSALDLDPKIPSAWLGLGDVYMALEKYQNARENYEKALALDPFDPAVLFRTAELARVRADHKTAERYYKRLILLAPDDLANFRYLALSQVALGRIDSAIETYETIIHQKADDIDSLVRLANLWWIRSRHDVAMQAEHKAKAKAILERAHALHPGNQAVLELLQKIKE